MTDGKKHPSAFRVTASAARLWAHHGPSDAAPLPKSLRKTRRPEQSKLRRETRWLLHLLGSGTRWPRRSGNRRAFLGRQKRYENVAFHARHGLDLPLVANFEQQPVHLGTPHFLVRHLAAAVKNHRSHFVAVTEEADNLILANLIIVFSGVGPKLD